MTAPSLIDPFKLKLWVFRADDRRMTGVHTALAAMHEKARRTRNGRPYVDGIKAFGVSHTMNWTAYLLATRKYVGIDLETWDRPDLAGLEQRLGPVITGGDSVQVGFLTSWVLKEACVKALGLGLLSTFQRVRVRAECSLETGFPGTRAFVVSLGRTEMRGLCFSFGPGLLGVAYRAAYGPPCLNAFLYDGRREL